jgi:hypothetical protein
VHTDQFSAIGTGPPAVLLPDKFPDTHSFYLFQVLNHAHAILAPVSFIQVFKALTGKYLTAVIAVFPFAFGTETQGAIFTAFCVWSQTAVAPIPVPDIANAKPAIHSAGCNIAYSGS